MTGVLHLVIMRHVELYTPWMYIRSYANTATNIMYCVCLSSDTSSCTKHAERYMYDLRFCPSVMTVNTAIYISGGCDFPLLQQVNTNIMYLVQVSH